MEDVSIENVANRDVNHYHYNMPSEGKPLSERAEIDYKDARLIADSFAELLGYFLVARLFDLLGRNERRMERDEDKVSYYALLSVDRKRIHSYIYGVLGGAYRDMYIANSPFQLVDVLAAGTDSDTAYSEISRDCDTTYGEYIDVPAVDIDVQKAQEQLKNTMLRLFERALKNPKQAILSSNDRHVYKDKYGL